MKKFDYKKLLKETWDNEVLSLVAQIHGFKGRQELFMRQKPYQLTRLVENSKIQSVEASNKIEGIVTTSPRIKQLLSDKIMPKTRDEEEIMGYRDVLNIVHENYEYIELKPSIILQLHRDLYKYSEKSIGGRFKNTQNYITETRMDGNTFVRFTPLKPYETQQAMDEICDSYAKAIDSGETQPLLLIPTFINDFLCIHPFNDGNGRMSRLLTALLLYQNGYFIGKYISIEKMIENTKGNYYEALRESGILWHEGKNTAVPFIKYLLRIILAAYKDFEERIDIASKGKGKAADIVKAAITNKIGKFTKSDLIELCPQISKASIENALKNFVELGEITRHGKGKNTFYTKN